MTFGPVSVTTMKIKPRTIPATQDYVGVAESSHLVDIRSRVEGYLLKIAYIEGSFVPSGALLFQIDPQPFEAALDNSKGELARQEAILWNAKTTKDRIEPLYKQNAASKRDYDNAIADLLSSEAAVLSAKAKVKEAELNLGYTSILAPVSGLTGEANFREGSLIIPAGSTGLLTSLSVIDPIWVNFSVSENDILKMRNEVAAKRLVLPDDLSFTVKLTLSDGSTFPEKGIVSYAAPILDQRTGTMTVRSVFPNPQKILKPGQFVRATVEGALRPNAIAVPQKAVLQGQKGMFVYIVKDGKAEPRFVEPGDWYQDEWVINTGLQPGDEVIIDGTNKVVAGAPIKVQPYNSQENKK